MSELSATTRLLEAIGLDATSQPLIEWQTVGAPIATPPAVSYIGSNTSAPSVDLTQLALPAGAAVGDLFVYTAASGPSFGNHSTACVDTRAVSSLEVETYFGSAWPNLQAIAWGYLTDLTDLDIDLRATDGSRRGMVSVWRVTGTVTAAWNFGDQTGLTSPPRVSDEPAAGSLGILAMAGYGIPSTLTPSGVWTSRATYGAAAQFSAVWDAASIGSVAFDGGNNWVTLQLGVGDSSGGGGDVMLGWETDPDRSHGLVSYSLTYGRNDVRARVQPAQITIVSALAVVDPPEVGDLFRIALTQPAADVLDLDVEAAARFTGEVTDIQVSPDSRTWQCVGVGTIARKGRTAVSVPTAQAASDRVETILDAIDTFDPRLILAVEGTIDEATVELAGVDAPSAGNTLLDDVATSTLGQTVQQLDGRVDWHGPDHRRGETPAIVLDAGEILSAIVWAKHVGSIVNRVTVNYSGGSVEVVDHASEAARGPYAVTVSTTLTSAAAARSLGQLLVGRFSSPAWDLPTLTVDVARSVDVGHLSELFGLRHGDRVTITDLPADGPVTGDHDFYLEGFSEVATPRTWRLGCAVSDPALSGVSLRWLDVDPFLTWDAVDAGVRWLDVVRFEDSGDLGTPTITLDGGDATTAVFARTIDGGDATTTTFVTTIDGGTA